MDNNSENPSSFPEKDFFKSHKSTIITIIFLIVIGILVGIFNPNSIVLRQIADDIGNPFKDITSAIFIIISLLMGAIFGLVSQEKMLAFFAIIDRMFSFLRRIPKIGPKFHELASSYIRKTLGEDNMEWMNMAGSANMFRLLTFFYSSIATGMITTLLTSITTIFSLPVAYSNPYYGFYYVLYKTLLNSVYNFTGFIIGHVFASIAIGMIKGTGKNT